MKNFSDHENLEGKVKNVKSVLLCVSPHTKFNATPPLTTTTLTTTTMTLTMPTQTTILKKWQKLFFKKNFNNIYYFRPTAAKKRQNDKTKVLLRKVFFPKANARHLEKS